MCGLAKRSARPAALYGVRVRIIGACLAPLRQHDDGVELHAVAHRDHDFAPDVVPLAAWALVKLGGTSGCMGGVSAAAAPTASHPVSATDGRHHSVTHRQLPRLPRPARGGASLADVGGAMRLPLEDGRGRGGALGCGMDGADIVTALRAVLPEDCVLTREEERRPYECDGLTAFRQPAPAGGAAAHRRAGATGTLTCSRLGVPVVARGSGTGPLRRRDARTSRVCCCRCARMNRILDIDPLARIARVQPGVRNLQVSEAAAAAWPVLRARSLLADRLLDRRQCRGELRRRALPQVRAHRAQRAGGARLHHRRRAHRAGQPRAGWPRARPAGARRSAPRAC